MIRLRIAALLAAPVLSSRAGTVRSKAGTEGTVQTRPAGRQGDEVVRTSIPSPHHPIICNACCAGFPGVQAYRAHLCSEELCP